MPELTVLTILVLATSLAAYAYAGVGIALVLLAGWAVVASVFLRSLVPIAGEPLIEDMSGRSGGRTSFLGFWRKRSIVRDATSSLVSYDSELRPTLQHLLAARLAERHSVSLYADPATARRLVLARPEDDAIWFWLDPLRAPETDHRRGGIPPRTLAAILDRLERL